MPVTDPTALSGLWLRSLVSGGRSANTVAAYRGDVSAYVRFLEHRGIRDVRRVGPEDVEAFVLAFATDAGRTGRPRADSTIARVVSAVRGFHAWAFERGLTVDDAAAGVPPPAAIRSAPVVLELDEVAALVASVDGTEVTELRDRAVLSLLVATGVRAAELIDLDTGDVREHGRRLHVRGDRPRPLPVADPRALRVWLERGRPSLGASTGALFPNARGGRLTRQSVWRLVTERARAAGLPDGTSPRTLRHTFAQLERAAGTPEDVVMELLGRTPWTGKADEA